MAPRDSIRLHELQMADSQLYITVALFVAMAAIVTDLHSGREGSLLPRRRINAVGLTLLAGAWVGILQIGWSMLVTNNSTFTHAWCRTNMNGSRLRAR